MHIRNIGAAVHDLFHQLLSFFNIFRYLCRRYRILFIRLFILVIDSPLDCFCVEPDIGKWCLYSMSDGNDQGLLFFFHPVYILILQADLIFQHVHSPDKFFKQPGPALRYPFRKSSLCYFLRILGQDIKRSYHQAV